MTKGVYVRTEVMKENISKGHIEFFKTEEGKKKAKNHSKRIKGKTYEELYGEKRAKGLKEKIAKAMKGHKNTLGKYWKMSDKGKKNISKAQNKRFENPKERKKLSKACKEGRTGIYVRTEIMRKNIGKSKRGNKYLLGYKHSEDWKRKNSERMKGNKHWNWLNGQSFGLYTSKFNNQLKNFIRKKFNYTCQKCGKKEKGRHFTPHHINYDKTNNKEKNFILLCTGCNVKVNVNRDYWKKYFQKIMKESR